MPAAPTFPIDTLLTELGFVRVDARAQARRALIEAGLTNERKQNMARDKRAAAIAAIDTRIARVCAAATCRQALDAGGRRVVEVASEGCEVCGGSDTARATQQMVADLVATGRTRLLVLGGSPNTRTALRDAVAGTPVQVTFVEGDRPKGVKRARAMVEAADVVVIWASTELAHKVSQPFAHVAPRKTLTCARRSVGALAVEVSRHVGG
ncbi:MAG: hypothetical protein WD058_02860 [Dehalococcoidia bacterium]